jgi:hypothetical protein
MKAIPNFLRNSNQILHNVGRHLHLFKPREGQDVHTSIIPGLNSRFWTLKDKDMDASLIKAIFADADFDPFLKDSYNFIQIQRYAPGDFIVPHKDLYSITKLHLIILTDSEQDGFVCEDGKGGLIRTLDKAGTYIDLDDEYHWVDPVVKTRYSLVVTE